RVAVPGPVHADAKIGFVRVDGEGIGRISLELDGVGASPGGFIDERERALFVLVVVAGELGNDKDRSILTDRAGATGRLNRKASHRLFPSQKMRSHSRRFLIQS